MKVKALGLLILMNLKFSTLFVFFCFFLGGDGDAVLLLLKRWKGLKDGVSTCSFSHPVMWQNLFLHT